MNLEEGQINKIAARLLYHASNYFIEHGCNDLHESILEGINKEDVLKFYRRELGDDDIDDVYHIQDWLFMQLIANQIDAQTISEIRQKEKQRLNEHVNRIRYNEKQKIKKNEQRDDWSDK